MITNLKIHKKYLADVEQYTSRFDDGRIYPYAVRYVFAFPQDSEYKDYALFVDTDDFKYSDGKLLKDSVGKMYEFENNYYTLAVKADEIFTINRYFNCGNDKKYKSYTLDVTQINAVFHYDKKIEDLALVVASFKKKITLAYSDGTWLYVDDERRRINSKGETILGNILPENKNDVAELIRSFYQKQDEINAKTICLVREDYQLDMIVNHCNSLDSIKASNAIRDICNNQRIENSQAAEKEKASLEALKANFERELSGYYISEDPAPKRERNAKVNNKPLPKKL